MKNFSSQKFFFLSTLVAIFGIFFVLGKYQAKAAPASSVYFEPANIAVNRDQNFSLEAKINPGSNQVSAVELDISYDKNKLRLQGVDNNASPFSQILSAAQIDNVNGKASIVLGIPLGNPPAYVTSVSKIATFNFQAIGEGSSEVSFTSETQAAAYGEGSVNVISSKTSAGVSVGRKYGNADFSLIAADWLKNTNSPGDFNGDGRVDARDIGVIMNNWQN